MLHQHVDMIKHHSASLGRFVPHHADVVYGICRGLPSGLSISHKTMVIPQYSLENGNQIYNYMNT